MSPDAPKLRQLQHKKFGNELRPLLAKGATREDRERGAIIVSELDQLARLKRAGQQHPQEERMHGGGLDQVRKLVLRQGHSIRIYFCVEDGVLWMLALDINKRRTKVEDGMMETLRLRYADIQKLRLSQKGTGT